MNPKKENVVECTEVCQSCPVSPVRSRLSFKAAIEKAEEQIEIWAIDRCRGEARELCMIIAEVWMMNPEGKIKVSGEFLDAYMVQEVFLELTCEHVQMVLEKFHAVPYLIQNKKAYLRAALYNSVFELSAHYANRVAHDMKQGV